MPNPNTPKYSRTATAWQAFKRLGLLALATTGLIAKPTSARNANSRAIADSEFLTASKSEQVVLGFDGSAQLAIDDFAPMQDLMSNVLQSISVTSGGSTAEVIEYGEGVTSTSLTNNLKQLLSDVSKMQQLGGSAFMRELCKQVIKQLDAGQLNPTADNKLVLTLFGSFFDVKPTEAEELLNTIKQKANGNVVVLCVGIKGTAGINGGLIEQVCEPQNILRFESVADAQAHVPQIATAIRGEPVTPLPTPAPTRKQTPQPSHAPTHARTHSPTTRQPTHSPTVKKTSSPESHSPTRKPVTHSPHTRSPFTHSPTTKHPTRKPTPKPTEHPTQKPTARPSDAPSKSPTKRPTKAPRDNAPIIGGALAGAGGLAVALALLYKTWKERVQHFNFHLPGGHTHTVDASQLTEEPHRVPLLGDDAATPNAEQGDEAPAVSRTPTPRPPSPNA